MTAPEGRAFAIEAIRNQLRNVDEQFKAASSLGVGYSPDSWDALITAKQELCRAIQNVIALSWKGQDDVVPSVEGRTEQG